MLLSLSLYQDSIRLSIVQYLNVHMMLPRQEAFSIDHSSHCAPFSLKAMTMSKRPSLRALNLAILSDASNVFTWDK